MRIRSINAGEYEAGIHHMASRPEGIAGNSGRFPVFGFAMIFLSHEARVTDLGRHCGMDG